MSFFNALKSLLTDPEIVIRRMSWNKYYEVRLCNTSKLLVCQHKITKEEYIINNNDVYAHDWEIRSVGSNE